MKIDTDLYIELLQDEVKRLRCDVERLCAEEPIVVNSNKIRPESRPAVGQMMNRVNSTLGYLNNEVQP